MKYFIQTFGCQMNVYDTKSMSELLNEAGYEQTEQLDDAEIILLNTCAIREGAEDRVRGRLGQMKKYKDKGSLQYLGVCGCMGQKEGERLIKDVPHLDMVMGPGAISSIVENVEQLQRGQRPVMNLDGIHDDVEQAFPVADVREITYPRFVSIMMGCDKKCTFCIVPYTRGSERSRPPRSIIQEAEQMVQAGYKELTFIGQTVNSYTCNGMNFSGLLEVLNETPGLERIRFTTSHPCSATNEMFETMQRLDKVCEQLHLPVQSGSDRILEIMERNYTHQEYLGKINYFRSLYESESEEHQPYISTDIIVGFPGETEEDFQQTLKLVETVRYDSAFMFKYSPRRGTPAAEMDGQVDEFTKSRRLDQLINLQKKIAKENSQQLIGKTVEVMVERENNDPKRGTVFECRMRQGRVVKLYDEPGTYQVGDFVNVNIEDASTYSLFGSAEQKAAVCVA